MRKRIWNDVYESGIEYGLESDKKLMIVEYMMLCSDLLNWNRNEWKKGIELIRTIDECGWIEVISMQWYNNLQNISWLYIKEREL